MEEVSISPQKSEEERELKRRLTLSSKLNELLLHLTGQINNGMPLEEVAGSTAVSLTTLLNLHHCQIEIEAIPATRNSVAIDSTSTVVFPIMHKHELLGTITAITPTPRQWLSEETTCIQIIAGQLATYVKTTQTGSANEHKAWEVSQLRQIIQLISDERDPHALAQQLTRHTIHLLHAEQGWIGYVYDDNIMVNQLYKEGQWQPVFWRIPKGEGAAGTALKQQKAYISQCANDPAINREYIEKFGCQQILALPIKSDGRVFGMIEIHNKRNGEPFTEEEVHSASVIAYQAALAIERRTLFAEMAQRANALETLLQVSAQLNEDLNPATLIRRLIIHSVNLVEAVGGLGGLVDGQGVITNHYWFQGAWHRLEMDALALAESVIESKRPIVVNTYAHHKDASPFLAATYQIHNALCLPILNLNDEPIGFLEVHNKMGDAAKFTQTDVELMASLANAAAVALGNSHLFKELNKQGAELRALSAKLVTVLEDERRRIAHELHDEAGQLLVGIKLNLRILAQQLPNELQTAVDDLRAQVNQANEKLQALARGLRPPTLDKLGLTAALEKLTQDLAQSSGLRIELETAVTQNSLNQQVEIAAYRIIQEALTNIVRHTNARQVWVSIVHKEDALNLKVRDNGQGFDLTGRSESGLGLLGMRERAAMLGGHFHIDTQPGQGVSIQVKLPT